MLAGPQLGAGIRGPLHGHGSSPVNPDEHMERSALHSLPVCASCSAVKGKYPGALAQALVDQKTRDEVLALPIAECAPPEVKKFLDSEPLTSWEDFKHKFRTEDELAEEVQRKCLAHQNALVLTVARMCTQLGEQSLVLGARPDSGATSVGAGSSQPITPVCVLWELFLLRMRDRSQ